jgi:hypothetical protein
MDALLGLVGIVTTLYCLSFSYDVSVLLTAETESPTSRTISRTSESNNRFADRPIGIYYVCCLTGKV